MVCSAVLLTSYILRHKRDLRSKSSLAKMTFQGRSEAVRDAQFSPAGGGVEFAAAFENGTVQKWDLRAPSSFVRKWSAHNGLALAVDWHPDGRVLASGGRDRLIKLWDTKTDSRKPFHQVQTIAPVAQIRWRPGHPTQIASTSLSIDNRIQIFDLCSPFVPILTVGEAEDAVTGLSWHSPGTLVSCSKDARLRVSALSASGKAPHRILNPCTSAWSPEGELAFALGREERDESLPRPGRRSQLSLLTGWDEKVLLVFF